MGRYSVSRKVTKVVRLPLRVATIARRIAEGSLKAGDLNAFSTSRRGAKLQCR